MFTFDAPLSLVGKGGHTLLLQGVRRGFEPRQLWRTKRAFFQPLAIWNEAFPLFFVHIWHWLRVLANACRLEFMICSLSSISFNFYLPVDFGFFVLFPHIFSVLYHYRIETSWFSPMMHESPFTEEKCIQSSFDANISMFYPPVLPQSASALSKNT